MHMVAENDLAANGGDSDNTNNIDSEVPIAIK